MQGRGFMQCPCNTLMHDGSMMFRLNIDHVTVSLPHSIKWRNDTYSPAAQCKASKRSADRLDAMLGRV